MLLWCAVIAAAAALCLGAAVVQRPSETLVRSADPAAPLVTAAVGPLFNATAAAGLRACVAAIPLGAGALGNGAFGQTRGLVAKFSGRGAGNLRRHPKLGCLSPLFDAVRDPLANAFVLNVLRAPPGTREAPVAWHIDQSVAFDVAPGYDHAAHSVSVYYVDVPQGMVGGALELVAFSEGVVVRDAATGKVGGLRLGRAGPGDRASVAPVANTLATFRGDAIHRVAPYAAPDGGDRVSVVLEQYRVGWRWSWAVTNWVIK